MVGDNGELDKEQPASNPEVVQGSSEKAQEKQIIPTDFKIAEIWLRNNVIHLDAAENFWMDKVRAIGVLEVCKDIVKQYQPPNEEKSKIVHATPHSMMNFVRNGFKKKGK